MSGDESFLARWARHKRGAARTARGRANPKNTEDGTASEAAAAPLPPEETQSLVDPASLPPIGSIGAGSDIRPFLVAGVPADLARAALRRAWSADPAIRDFIGLSENSWDFNLPGGVAGFGPLTAEDARRLLAQTVGEPEAADSARSAAETSSADRAATPTGEAGTAARDPAEDQQRQDHNASTDRRDSAPDGKINVAAHYESGERAFSRPLPRRGHGGALPK